MKFSYSWLKQLVDTNLPAAQLAEFLSLHAFEAEVVSGGQEFPNIIVAKVTKVEKHPNADRLRVIELTDGDKTIAPVVCGAWNFDVGAIVPLALPGAMIPHDQHDPAGKPFSLGKATIRGVESHGMICSAKELGLGDDGGGILLLDKNRKLGETFSVRPESSEVLFDISVPANRPDLISYRGIAWEISALTGKKYLVKPTKHKVSQLSAKILKVRISDTNLCKKYLAARLVNVKIGPSPKFIQDGLKASGIRSVNNVVDITNYAMLEVGQPLHAFDAGKVIGPINVRKAYVQESITTLDGVKRKLTPDMLVIADNTKVLAVAGVMGGESSAINEYTTELILESANFNAVSVRRTSQALGLRTDASSRYEKSLPVAFTGEAMEYACELLEKYANAKTIEFASAGAKPEKRSSIQLDPAKVNKLLGTGIPAGEQQKILTKSGFGVAKSKSLLSVAVPFWRPDVTISQDLAEEVERFKGLDTIKPQSMYFPVSASMIDKLLVEADTTRDLLVDLGLDEVYTYSFVSEDDLSKWQIDKKIAIEIENPLSSDQQYLRPNLAMNILKVAEHNQLENEFLTQGKYFEIANVYWRDQGKTFEKTYLCMFVFPRTKATTEKLVGDFRELARRLGVSFEISQKEEQSADILVHGRPVGHIGAVTGTSNIDWIGVSLDFEAFIKQAENLQFQAINRFPSVDRDTSISVRDDVQWAEIKKAIISSNQKLVAKIILVESSYKGKEITPGKKSMTFRIVYQAPNRTLTKDEVNKIHESILATLKTKFHAEVRD